ncbi:MAG TPA: class I SAM-dependent methyltransferase [Gaiellaceae bacterium]
MRRLLQRLDRTPASGGPPSISTRDVAAEPRPDDGGLEGFETPDAHAINRARLEHLDSLGLDLAGRSVLDVGAGPAHLAQYFVGRGCRIVSTDARPENVEQAKRLYPGHDARVLDVERDDVAAFGRFDIVFCYGLLYHLEDPLLVLRKLVDVCDDLFLLETMVCDSALPILRLEDEYLSLNQALRGIAHRPSPAWVAMAFDRIGVHNVYTARTPPQHPDYDVDWRNNLDTARDGHLLRAIFVASRTPLTNDRLVPLVAAP